MSSSIWVCPFCGGVVEWDREYGASCWHEEYGEVEAVEVEGRRVGGELVFSLPDSGEWRRTVGERLLREKAERDGERARWLGLSCEERLAELEELRRRDPLAATFRRMYGDMFRDWLLGDATEVRRPCGRCGEVECENATVEKREPVDLGAVRRVEFHWLP